ncbi:corrinoid protein [Syntrophaceticus schinkii]|jgi:corrinoid protein of di/trimethylamine methyltransferase|uniref:Trimethylamine corrinoid protein n=1 Tax=Syntrophaceticus schinkii TaxID=499207 RepID=A0A0B7ME66_9FIRM|nr:corrinoid protein [Syntrophaceticus schinkii]CEO88859.1 Trimethylamine corrinoid protein [Syntrophaceticus schinkii]HHV41883.1 cobalamin-binding protein [Clostridiaceae bacterium]
MDQENILSKLSEAVFEGEEELVPELTNKAVDAGIEPLRIINEGLTRGIEVVGERFESGEYFLPDLLLGAKAMEAGIAIVEPMLEGTNREFVGRVLMGTVHGDLHSIGKNIVIMMLKSAGFEVFDLGVDVPTSAFIEKIRKLNPDIVGISALLTTTVGCQKEIIESLKEEGLRDSVKIMIGGAPINQNWADQIGADGYAEDASSAAKLAKRLMG